MNLAMFIQFSGMLYDNRGCNSADIYLINLLDLDLYITLHAKQQYVAEDPVASKVTKYFNYIRYRPILCTKGIISPKKRLQYTGGIPQRSNNESENEHSVVTAVVVTVIR